MLSTLGQLFDAVRADGWQNAILGLGGVKDPSTYTRFTARAPLAEDVLEALYVEDHFAAKIVETLPKHALRPGWQLTVPGDPQVAAKIREAYAAREEELELAAEMAQGWCWGRVFGGALTWIGADDGNDASAPLDESAIKSVRWLHTFDRRDVQIWRYYSDPKHPKFRQPELYKVRPLVQSAPAGGVVPDHVGAGIVVHESRCVVWGGQSTTDRRRQQLQGWDDSILERCWEALRQLSEDFGAKSLMLGRISQAVYKIKDLYAMIAGKREEVLRRRIGMLDVSRSRSRAIVLDTDEDFINHTQSLSGLPETLNASILRLASAADMPVTILMGQSPAGMDATGESDLEVWSATCASERSLYLTPRHERIARLLLLAQDGPTGGVEPESWKIHYNPLREPTRKELAEVGKLEVETDAIAIEKGIYSADHAALRYAPGGGRPQLDEAEIEERLERRRQLAGQPPKDNAELGTVAPRTTAVLEVIAAVRAGTIARESGLAVLTTIHRHTLEDAEALLGPEPGETDPSEAPITPGSEWIDTEDGHRMRVTGIDGRRVLFVDLDSETPERQYAWQRATFAERCRPVEGAPAAAPPGTPGPEPDPQPGQGAGAPQPPA